MPDRGVVISCTDVTAEREAARKLYELNEILEQRVMERTLELEDAPDRCRTGQRLEVALCRCRKP